MSDQRRRYLPNVTSALLFSLHGDDYADIKDYISKEAAKVGFEISGFSHSVSTKDDILIYDYIQEQYELNRSHVSMWRIAAELMRGGYEYVQENDWDYPVLPGHVGIELLRHGFRIILDKAQDDWLLGLSDNPENKD